MSSKFTKISQPRIAMVYPRQRLFSQLDEVQTRPLVWIGANPGAGKTVLVVSYLEARQLPVIWYRLDSRDADAATFFYYLREAALQAGLPRADTLPLLTAEYAGAEVEFAQNFFAQLFAGIAGRYALVFDNFQDLPEASALHGTLGEALQELPSSIRVFILSRAAAPAWLARWQVNQIVTIIDPPALHFDREETVGMLALQSNETVSQEAIDTIHREADGWAAGIILLHEHISRYGLKELRTRKLSREAMFRYFATELYENASQDMRWFLSMTAIVPQFDIEMARSLTGMKNVGSLLHELLRRNFFIYEHAELDFSYQYHPLFREFLRDISRRDIDHTQYHGLLRSAARALRNSGQVEDAADLYMELQDWAALTDIVVSEANQLYRQGRWRQIDAWIAAIPESLRYAVPWLDYWFGVCRMGFDMCKSRDAFVRASAGFTAAQDILGRGLSAAGVVDTYIYEQGNFCPLDRWIDELDSLLAEHVEDLPAEVLARVSIALFIAATYRRPDHPRLPELAQQVYQIIERMPNDLLRLTAGNYLLFYFTWWQGDMARADSVVKLLKPLAQSSHIAPILQIVWLSIQATYAWMAGDTASCIESAEQGLRIADQTGLHLWDTMTLAQAGFAALTSDNMPQARIYLERLPAMVQPGRLNDLSQYRYLLFVEALHHGDAAAMHDHSSVALQLAKDAGVLWVEGIILPACAYAEAAQGNYSKASELLARAGEIAKSLGSNTIYYSELLARVELNLPGDDTTAALRELMRVSNRSGFVNSALWRGTAMSRIFAQALSLNIEVPFVKEVIRRRALLPDPDIQPTNWPWPVRIYTLGRFSLVLNEEPVSFTGKTQKRPLELLKALIAFGGRNVSEESLCEALWPEAEGDAAHSTFTTTLSRLRKLLGNELLQLSDGKLSLNSTICWVDVWALERFLGQAERALHKQTPAIALDDILTHLQRHYRGHFLQNEGKAWVLSLRERMKGRILRVINMLIQTQSDAQQIIALHEFALQVDDLAENAYRGLMACLAAQGRYAEALAVYERCRNLLQAHLGIEPAEKTRQLAVTIQSGDESRLSRVYSGSATQNT